MHVGNPTDSASVHLIGAEYKGGGGTRERPMRNRAVIADQIVIMLATALVLIVAALWL